MTDTIIVFDRIQAQSDGQPQAADVSSVALAFELRQRSRLRVTIEFGPMAGLSVGIELPRGTVMRAGLLLGCATGEHLRIDAAAEQLAQVEADTPLALTAIAYHLGNRHVPVQLGEQWLRLQQDHVLEQMVVGLGGRTARIDAAFEPESGAYHGGGHGHDHPPPDRRHSPVIHDLANPDEASES